jgi:hypothetical protein
MATGPAVYLGRASNTLKTSSTTITVTGSSSGYEVGTTLFFSMAWDPTGDGTPSISSITDDQGSSNTYADSGSGIWNSPDPSSSGTGVCVACWKMKVTDALTASPVFTVTWASACAAKVVTLFAFTGADLTLVDSDFVITDAVDTWLSTPGCTVNQGDALIGLHAYDSDSGTDSYDAYNDWAALASYRINISTSGGSARSNTQVMSQAGIALSTGSQDFDTYVTPGSGINRIAAMWVFRGEAPQATALGYEAPSFIGKTTATAVTAGTQMTITNIESVAGAKVGDTMIAMASVRGTALSAHVNPSGWTVGFDDNNSTFIDGFYYKTIVAGTNSCSLSWTGSGDGIMNVWVVRGKPVVPGNEVSQSWPLDQFYKDTTSQTSPCLSLTVFTGVGEIAATNLSLNAQGSWVLSTDFRQSSTIRDLVVGIAYNPTLFTGTRDGSVIATATNGGDGGVRFKQLVIEPHQLVRMEPAASGTMTMLATTTGPGVKNAPTYVGYAGSGSTTPGTSVTLNLPSGWQPGDMAICMIRYAEPSATDAPSTPSGWTARGSGNQAGLTSYKAMYRRLQSGDTTWISSFGVDTYETACWLMLVFRYVETIRDVGGGSSGTTSTTVDATSATTAADELIVMPVGYSMAAGSASGISSDPSNMTRVELFNTVSGSVRNSAVGFWTAVATGASFDPAVLTLNSAAYTNHEIFALTPTQAIDSSPVNYIANSYFVDLTGWSTY